MANFAAFHQTNAPVYAFNGGLMKMHLTGARTGGAFCLIESIIPPDMVTPVHVHNEEDEAFLVMEGELTIVVAGQAMTVRQGESAFAPRGVPHQLRNTSGNTVWCIVVSTSAGFGEFVMAAGTQVDDSAVAVPAPDPAQFVAAATRYGIQLAD